MVLADPVSTPLVANANFLSSQGRAGSMLGPLTLEDCAGVITSRMAVIPKKLQASGGSLWTCHPHRIAA